MALRSMKYLHKEPEHRSCAAENLKIASGVRRPNGRLGLYFSLSKTMIFFTHDGSYYLCPTV